ncbi:MAG TPA: hypothetical protein VMV18_04320, partial [bacterium]|nr:hypothetical protein [bacterium]
MRSRPMLIVALLLAGPAHASSRASRSVTVDLTPAEKLLVDDARDDKLDRFDPVTAAIATSTASQDVKDRAQTRWLEFLNGLTSEAMARPPRARAEFLLQAMHAQLLGGGYAFYQNDVALLLDDGTFNCVTSAIVYHAIAQHFGLDVRGVLVPSHVYER